MANTQKVMTLADTAKLIAKVHANAAKGVRFEYDGTKIHDYFISGWISILLDRKRPANRDGVRVVGCGMDMGFDLVYRLSMELYGDGYALNARWL